MTKLFGDCCLRTVKAQKHKKWLLEAMSAVVSDNTSMVKLV